MANRFDRQERVKAIGVAGQQRISQATVLIAGVGALGSYTAEQLVRAGVHKLILIDPDTVSLTNLQRQALFTEDDVQQHQLKVDAAKTHLLAINSEADIVTYPEPLNQYHLTKLHFDLVLDCLDNFRTRDLLNKAALVNDFDYIFASCAGTFGSVMPISPRHHACLSCVYPNLEALKQTDCDLIGVNTALVPLISALQVSLALHVLVDPETVNYDQLTTIDNWSLQQQAFKIRKTDTCPVCHRTDWSLAAEPVTNHLSVMCGTQTYAAVVELPGLPVLAQRLIDRHIDVKEFKHFLSFNWQDYQISLFENGRVLLYGLPDLTQANQLFADLSATLFQPSTDIEVSEHG